MLNENRALRRFSKADNFDYPYRFLFGHILDQSIDPEQFEVCLEHNFKYGMLILGNNV